MDTAEEFPCNSFKHAYSETRKRKRKRNTYKTFEELLFISLQFSEKKNCQDDEKDNSFPRAHSKTFSPPPSWSLTKHS
jgi:hypothetical protein